MQRSVRRAHCKLRRPAIAPSLLQRQSQPPRASILQHDRLLRCCLYIQRRENGERNRLYIEYYSDDKYRNIIWYGHMALSVTIVKFMNCMHHHM
jgi:hypothetical protein